MPEPRYPEIRVKLTGKDGNAFAILGRVQRALRNAGVDRVEVKQFMMDATAGDYNHLLQVCLAWVNCK